MARTPCQHTRQHFCKLKILQLFCFLLSAACWRLVSASNASACILRPHTCCTVNFIQIRTCSLYMLYRVYTQHTNWLLPCTNSQIASYKGKNALFIASNVKKAFFTWRERQGYGFASMSLSAALGCLLPLLTRSARSVHKQLSDFSLALSLFLSSCSLPATSLVAVITDNE